MVLGCNDHPIKDVTLVSDQEVEGEVDVAFNRAVDILFVIDNSGSMGQEQATLARNFGTFIEPLNDVEADYRVAFTTTDTGNRWAQGCSSPENGQLVLRSCRDREQDFTWNGISQFAEACSDVCQHESIAITPTRTHQDPEAKQRPWIEKIGNTTNIADIDLVDAFSCFGPQGISGCGMETPLEAMYRALYSFEDPNSPSYGFIRPGAILAVVFVTDEVDCSAPLSDDFKDVWDPSGTRTFWGPDNDRDYVTSGLCWHAGVGCETAEDGTTSCTATNYAVDGQVTDDSGASVLFGLDRYIELLGNIELVKQRITPNQEVQVALIGGVPPGYPTSSLVYDVSGATYPDYTSEFGAAPGCSAPGNGEAMPPVRLLEFAREFSGSVDAEPIVHSVCQPDYSDALRDIVGAIVEQIEAPCVKSCAADTDPAASGLQPSCTLKREWTDIDSGRAMTTQVKQCLTADDGFEFPGGADSCFRYLIEEELPLDCSGDGWNLGIEVEDAEGFLPPPGGRVRATCAKAQNQVAACPDLPR